MEKCQCDDMPEPFALMVHGDSMLPEFKDGDIIIVDPGATPKHNDFVVTEYHHDVSLAQYIENDTKSYLITTHNGQPARELTPEHKHKGVVTQKKRRRQKLVRYDLVKPCSKKT